METLENHELLIDLGCEILIQFDKCSVQFEGNLIGLEKDELIIVKPKPLSGLGSTVGKGDQAQALYLCDGTVYAFRSTLIHLLEDPLPLLFLSFPNKVQTSSFRTLPRASAFLPASVVIKDRRWTGALLDMSPAGLRFACGPAEDGRLPRLGINDPVEITTCRLCNGTTLVMNGKIRNFKDAGEYLTLGIKLLQPSMEARTDIKTYLNQIGFLSG